nr:MAG TPA: Spermatogenesis-associated protein 3 family [Caudoviricetes sp.]DAU80231.1 MAG TPA: Spermatogenesis-associated protein 3 family [Caudoviricetes sp.]
MPTPGRTPPASCPRSTPCWRRLPSRSRPRSPRATG